MVGEMIGEGIGRFTDIQIAVRERLLAEEAYWTGEYDEDE